jgi:pimeloyl-ACP methyl ester carboxylesterase
VECVIKNLKIYYEIHGKGFPIIMIHGFGPDHRILKGCMEPIFKAKKNYKRIYFDLPGMGKTKSVSWIKNSDHMLEIILKFIQKVISDEIFLIVGESYGAYLARGIIEKKSQDVSGVCFISPVIITDKSKRTLSIFYPIIKDSEFLSSLPPSKAKDFKGAYAIQTEKIWKRYKEEVDSGVEVADTKFLNKYYEEGYSFSFDGDQLNQKFEKPSLFLMGRQDGVVGYHDAYNIIENYPRASFVVLDKAAHDVQIEQEMVFNTLINELLDRVKEYAEKVISK